jgi:hypothetical protein
MQAIAYKIDGNPVLTWPAAIQSTDENGLPIGEPTQNFEPSIAALPPGTLYELIDEADVPAWLAANQPPAEKARQHNAPIMAELAEIDRKSARALRAIVAGTATDDDRAMLTELNARADALRGQLLPEVN